MLRTFRFAKPKTRMMPPKESARLECEGHLSWVHRKCICCVAGKRRKSTDEIHECFGRLDPHHEPPVSRGGGDHQVAPLCRKAHDIRHSIGRKRFEEEFAVDLTKVGKECWWADEYHRLKHEREQGPINLPLTGDDR